jgi:RNA polymerase sigma factor (sigma-70 family)
MSRTPRTSPRKHTYALSDSFLAFAVVRRAHGFLKIVRNTCYTWLHANRPLQDAAEFDENVFSPDSRAANPEEAVLQNDSNTLVRKALEKLPPNFRKVLILRELEEMSYREIADITGMPAGTVMSSLSRARGRLHRVLTTLMNVDAGATSSRIGAVNA